LTLSTSGICTCPGSVTSTGDCLVCASGQYFSGTACLSCSSNCTACTKVTGVCTTCTAPYSVQSDGSCGCDLGYYYSSDSDTCIQASATCDTGYYNDGKDNCVACGTNCTACTAYTGVCTTCVTGTSVDSVNTKICSVCSYHIGPVANPKMCIGDRYSSTRVIPPYSSSVTSLDWRDWTVVNSVLDQGVCGSCYSFSTIAAAESAYAIATGKLYKLSEQ
jgi:hypothetical protein